MSPPGRPTGEEQRSALHDSTRVTRPRRRWPRQWPPLALAIFAAGCASPAPPALPEALRPAPDEVPSIEAFATGVQIYQCTAVAGPPAHDEWVFQAPEAELSDASGRSIGRHFAGPTWQASDGSSVVGAVKARDDGPDTSAIPWLRLAAKSHAGEGVMASVSSVLRFDTRGGKAPPSGCSRDNEGQLLRVPYQARYDFYVPRR